MSYDARRDLTNRTVRAAIMDFLLSTMRTPNPTNPLPPGPTPKVVVAGWKEGRATTAHAITLALEIQKEHQRRAFAALATKFSIDHLPSDQVNHAVTQQLEQMVLGAIRGDAEALELLAWLKANAEAVLKETLERALPGPVIVTMAHGLPVRVRRVDG